MSLLTAIRTKRRSVIVLNVVVFTWLSALFTPCAMAFVTDVPTHVTASVFHEDCPNAEPANQITDSECCCDLTTATSSEILKLAKLAKLVALPAQLDLPILDPSCYAAVHAQRPPLDRSSPPVYLATQRLRI